MTAKIIDFEERCGWIKNLAMTRKAAQCVGPISNKIIDDYVGSDCCIMDPTHYPDPSLEEYTASAGYPEDDGEPIA